MKKKLFVIIVILCMFFVGTVKADDENYDVYNVGDKISVNDEEYYVISNSGEELDYVTVLKANPLTVDEINTYGGVGTADNHVNQYTDSNVGTAYDYNDTNHTGGMAYYSSTTCITNGTDSGCTNVYSESEVKYVIDAWATSKFTNGELKTVDGYGARLIAYSELIDNLGSVISEAGSYYVPSVENTPNWVYNSEYEYWTISPHEDSTFLVWFVSNKMLGSSYPSIVGAVRPVINVYKSNVTLIEAAAKDINNGDNGTDNSKISNKKVKVDNTLLKKSLLLTSIGLLLVGLGIITYICVKKSQKKSN